MNKEMARVKNTDMESARGQFLVYQAEDGELKLDVRFEDESVWLSQKLMAELFQKDVRTISEHIQNIYDEGELEPMSTIRKIRTVQMEGARQVGRLLDYYNLALNNLVEQYLIFAQGQAMRRIPMKMNDWIKKLDSFMALNDRDVLKHAGKISHEMAKQMAEGEYGKFHTERIAASAKEISDFDKAVKQIEPLKDSENILATGSKQRTE